MSKKKTLAEQHDELIEFLKFTPVTYTVRINGYGGETAAGTVKKSIADYFRDRRLSVPDYSWDHDYADDNNIPEDMQPFPAGSWYECDNIEHIYGGVLDSCYLLIDDENGNTVYEQDLSDTSDADIEIDPGNDVDLFDRCDDDEVVFMGISSEKGCFFEAELYLTRPFKPSFLRISTEIFDGTEYITGVSYDDQELMDNGADTNGKGFESFFVTLSDNGYKKYVDHDSIEYTTTDWFPADIKPTRPGVYEIMAPESDWVRNLKWTGQRWVNVWDDDKSEPVKISSWRGIDHDPDAVITTQPQLQGE